VKLLARVVQDMTDDSVLAKWLLVRATAASHAHTPHHDPVDRSTAVSWPKPFG
jgi:hypothetical protein